MLAFGEPGSGSVSRDDSTNRGAYEVASGVSRQPLPLRLRTVKFLRPIR